MKSLKIGYQPLSPSLKSAGDRRRLLFWAKNRGHTVITDLSQRVDVLVASENSDFQSTVFAKKKVPVIFDLVDAYLSPLNPYDDFARGLAKKLTGQISGGVKPFSHHVRKFCMNSDAVICSSIEQEAVINPLNSNTHIILDSHEEIKFIEPKIAGSSHSIEKRILWEGQPATIRGVQQISPVLFELSRKNNLYFDFVTDEKYFEFLGKFFKRKTSHLLKQDLNSVFDRMRIVPWSPDNLAMAAQKSSIAMIPIDLSIPMQKLKPENRLLIMWRLGLPCLTSSSSSYARVSRDAGVSAACGSQEIWLDKFNNLLNDPVYAHREILLGQNYIRETHSKTVLLNKWDQAIESVMR